MIIISKQKWYIQQNQRSYALIYLCDSKYADMNRFLEFP